MNKNLEPVREVAIDRDDNLKERTHYPGGNVSEWRIIDSNFTAKGHYRAMQAVWDDFTPDELSTAPQPPA